MKTLDGFLIGVIGGLVGGFVTYLAIKDGKLDAQEKFLASIKAERDTKDKVKEVLNILDDMNKDLDDMCKELNITVD